MALDKRNAVYTLDCHESHRASRLGAGIIGDKVGAIVTILDLIGPYPSIIDGRRPRVGDPYIKHRTVVGDRHVMVISHTSVAIRAVDARVGHIVDDVRPLDIRTDIVGQPPSIEIGVPNMPSLKAKKLSKLSREKVLLEL